MHHITLSYCILHPSMLLIEGHHNCHRVLSLYCLQSLEAQMKSALLGLWLKNGQGLIYCYNIIQYSDSILSLTNKLYDSKNYYGKEIV